MKTISSSKEVVILGLGMKLNPASISSISLNSAPQKLDDFSKNRTKIRRVRKLAQNRPNKAKF
jgi:hypothetical protein